MEKALSMLSWSTTTTTTTTTPPPRPPRSKGATPPASSLGDGAVGHSRISSLHAIPCFPAALGRATGTSRSSHSASRGASCVGSCSARRTGTGTGTGAGTGGDTIIGAGAAIIASESKEQADRDKHEGLKGHHRKQIVSDSVNRSSLPGTAGLRRADGVTHDILLSHDSLTSTAAYTSSASCLDQSRRSLSPSEHSGSLGQSRNALMPASSIYRSVSYSSTPIADSIMRRASPMPQPLPQSAYGSPSWQQATNGLTSPQDSTPPQGKTSQVLAKLTSDCERLRREIKAERAAKEEAVMQLQALKGRVHWLEENNGTLSMQLDSNESALARKERRLDDMKASLEEELARRKRAEAREAEMGRKLGETVSQAAKEVSEAHAARKNVETAYSTLQTEYNGLRRRVEFLRREVEELEGKINRNNAVHRQQFTQLEILLDQQRHQQEKSDRQVLEMSTLLRSYRETEDNTKRLEIEMERTVHEMRWVMQLDAARSGSSRAQESRAMPLRGQGSAMVNNQPPAKPLLQSTGPKIPASNASISPSKPVISSPLKGSSAKLRRLPIHAVQSLT